MLTHLIPYNQYPELDHYSWFSCYFQCCSNLINYTKKIIEQGLVESKLPVEKANVQVATKI